ncbi:MAG: radical SAM protein [Candidatus Omnitrophota bacterium]
MFDTAKKRYRFRLVIPAYPAVNIYSLAAKRTTALGPVCVASVVNKMDRWDAEVIDENNLRRFGPRSFVGGADHEFLQNQRPADIVGLYGGLTSTIPRLFEIAKYYKSRNIITIAGGQHFSEDTALEALNSGIDYLVIGEGEETIKEFITAMEQGSDISNINGLAYLVKDKVVFTQKREPVVDFDDLPLPDFSLVRYAKIDCYPVGRIRGCGMNCEFCAVKGKLRYATPERFIEQISFIVETKNAKKFFIVDDLFGQQRDETIRVCNMIRDYQQKIGKRLSFGIQIRLDKAKDPELLLAMRQAGVNSVAIGFESPIKEELKSMEKQLAPEEMQHFVKLFHKFGFIVHGMFIFGYPTKESVGFYMTARERIKRLKNFIRKSRIDTIQVLLPVPLPGTELRRRLQKDNRLYSSKDVGWEYYDGNYPLFEPDKPMTAEEMQNSIWKIMSKFYQFKYMFFFVLNIFSFPSMIFFLHNIKAGWRRWYRPWHNYSLRFAGWIFLKKWTRAFQKDTFGEKLKKAKENLQVNTQTNTEVKVHA